jgi:hypothetical protein
MASPGLEWHRLGFDLERGPGEFCPVAPRPSPCRVAAKTARLNLVILQDRSARGIDVGHQLMAFLIAAIGMIALGEIEIRVREFRR